MSAQFRLEYHPALDGVRGVSIIAVIAYHTGLITGGFLGVDVFFVLSGFLITSLLVNEFDMTGRVSFRAFYKRRALRLLPALVPVVVVAGIAMLAWDLTQRTVLFLLSVVFYVANWSMVYGLRSSMLGHTWSLSFEEQFYLLWPPILLLLLRGIRRRGMLLSMVTGAACLAVIYRFVIMSTPSGMRRLYLGLDAHADPILIGCAAAIFCASPFFGRTRRAVLWWDALGVVGALVLAAAFLLARFPVHYVLWSMSTVVGVASAFVIIAGVLPASRCASIFGRESLCWVGKRSYGLYLWHFPVLYLAGGPLAPGVTLNPVAALVGCAITCVLAALSFRYIETPALALRSRVDDGRYPRAQSPVLISTSNPA